MFSRTDIPRVGNLWCKSRVKNPRVKNLPAMQKMWVQSLGQKDPLENEMAAHSSILAWEIPRAEEPGGLQPMGSQEVGRDLGTKPPPFPE